MKKLFQLLTCCCLCCTAGKAQRVIFSCGDHIFPHQAVTVRVAEGIDTAAWSFDPVSYVVFLNNSPDRQDKHFNDRDTIDGWFRDPLLQAQFNPGFHSFLIGFSDHFSRGYNCFVHPAVVNAAPNLFERIKIPVKSGDYKDLVDYLKNLMATKDSGQIAGLLPAGMKAVLCVDFMGFGGEGRGDDGQYCMATQYLFAAGTATQDKVDGFFAAFLGLKQSSVLYTLLGGGWQMTAAQFDGNQLPAAADVFGGYGHYLMINHPNQIVNEKIRIGYSDAPTAHRLLIFINN